MKLFSNCYGMIKISKSGKGKKMKRIFAPWRSSYAGDVSEKKTDYASSRECVFCQQLEADQDEKYQIIKRFEHCALMMNKFPYNAGHALLLPNAHIGTLEKLTPIVRADIMEALSLSVTVFQQVLKPDGINIGINLGKAAGAGIPSHLHVHLLPRWEGDTNFMPTIAETKVISFDLNEIYKKLVAEFQKI